MSHHFQTLSEQVIALSEATTWIEAKTEWSPSEMWEEEGGTCTCGYCPITQHNEIRNRLNQNLLVVGRICVKQFFDLPQLESIWSAYDRLRRDPDGHIPDVLTEMAVKQGVISQWEHGLITSCRSKRRLSSKQLFWRKKAATKVLSQFQRNA